MGNSLQKPSKNGDNHHFPCQIQFTCQICIEPISTDKKFKMIKKSCDHPFCIGCIAKYIEVMIEDKVANIHCPGLNCKQRLDPLSCRPIIPPSLFSKWCDLLCDDYVLGFERSYCPNRNCMALVVNECGENVKKTQCVNCKQLFCFQCKSKWHAGYRCKEAEHMRDSNDILFGQLVEARSWIRCPHCGHCIQHSREGCSMIQCRCSTYLCYKCGEKVSQCKCGRACADWCNNWWVRVTIVLIWLLCVIILYYTKS